MLVWGGHSCLPFLRSGLFWVCSESKNSNKKSKTNVKGSGQECPLYSKPKPGRLGGDD
jgi:hypothetical protein